MTKERFLQIANEKKSKRKHGKNLLFAALFGGYMGIACQGLHDLYALHFSDETSFVLSSLTIVLLTGILTALNIYKKVSEVAGAGLFLPVSGFSNSVISSAIDAKTEGPIHGIGSNMFHLAGSVITFGFFSAILAGILYYFVQLFGGAL